MEPTTLRSHNISSGESPPPPPRVCFGRDELIKKIVGLAEDLTPIALIGAGGIGKTSIALTALHDNRAKQRFGDNRRFIRCDQFPASHTHFLRRLSTVIGAGVENPEDLTPLRPFLSSKEMFIIIDNAESILDPQGTSAQEIYTVVEELSQFNNICLCITTRISTIPPDCETLRIPTLPMEAARDAFYRIYKNGERSDQINNILDRLDFHPLSVTLLATVAHHNTWDTDRLAREWDQHRTGVLKTEHNKSLAATIELSLSSPMFQKLGPNAHDLLGVIAFFPQGIDENNLNWLFPTVSDRTSIFDKFCILSLTYRAGGFVTMLAPLRDYLCPKHPQSSSLLCTTKDCYFDRLSVDVQPGEPGFEEARWIMSEDANVEHLLDVFISIDPGAADIWDACYCFMEHIRWHKKRLVVLGPKIEGLPDDHHAKPQCLSQLSRLFQLVGNHVEEKRLLICALKLWMERGIDFKVAETLRSLSDTNRSLRLYEEGIPQAKEALEIYERLNIIPGQARSLQHLAQLLCNVGQLEAAEEAASRALRLLLEGQCHKYLVCQCHRALGSIYLSKGEMEKAKNQLEAALKIASSFNWPAEQFWNHYGLAELVSRQGRFDDAHAHIERAKSYTADNAYHLGRAMKLQAHLRYIQCQPKEARTETLRAIDVFEKLGDTRNVENCRLFLRFIPAGTDIPVTSNDSGLNGEPLGKVPLFTPTNSSFSAWEQSDGTDDSSLDTFRPISSV